MKKLFGTDGIRGRVNKYPLTGDLAFKLGQAIALKFRNKNKIKVLIGKDTRQSGFIFEYAMASGLCSIGADVFLAGVTSTPAIAYLTRTYNADVGVAISASHNPAEDNGIKLFDAQGYKLPDEIENDIEDIILLSDHTIAEGIETDDIGKVCTVEDSDTRYIEFSKKTVNNILLDDIKIVLDCAHGAAFKVAPQIFMELGAEVIVLGNKPDGININEGYGALHPEVIKSEVLKHDADIGIALDGDADRIIMVDEKGNVLDGDRILAVCGLFMHENNLLTNNTIVGTVMSNIGFELFLKDKGVNFVRTNVGDRYVIQEMKNNNYNLGGEQSGHIILSDFNSTGDGVITALQVLNIMKKSENKLSNLSGDFVPYPQVQENIKVKEKKPINDMQKVTKAIFDVENELKKNGRVLVRYSGTEKKCRVMVEGNDLEEIKKHTQIIVNEIKNEIGE